MNRAPGATPAQPAWERALGVVGIGVHIAVGYFYLTAGLVTPLPWLIGFLLLWVALLVLGILLLRQRPLAVLLVPIVAFGLLVGGVSLGGALLGWSA